VKRNKKGQSSTNRKSYIFLAAAGLLLMVTAGCGSSKVSASKAPDAVIKGYVAKHEVMVDPSLAGLYVVEEQGKVTEQINSAIAARSADGSLEDMQAATFDFSDLRIEIIGEKEDHVNDEIKKFIKVAITGNYTITVQGIATEVDADEVIILRREANVWKITAKANPWA